jgi:hypothetical protein
MFGLSPPSAHFPYNIQIVLLLLCSKNYARYNNIMYDLLRRRTSITVTLRRFDNYWRTPPSMTLNCLLYRSNRQRPEQYNYPCIYYIYHTIQQFANGNNYVTQFSHIIWIQSIARTWNRIPLTLIWKTNVLHIFRWLGLFVAVG